MMPENSMVSSKPRHSFDADVWVDALSRLALEANVGNSFTALLDRVSAVTCQLTGFDFCGVLLLDADDAQLRIEGFSGLTADYVAKINTVVPLHVGRKPTALSPSMKAFSSSVPVWVVDLQTSDEFSRWSDAAAEQGFHTMLSVPLCTAETLCGTLNCYTRATRDPEPQTIRIVQALADFAGAAIQMSRLRSTEEQRMRELLGANEELRGQKQQLEQIRSVHRELTDVVLAGGRVSAIAAALSKVLDGCPVRIEDARGHLIGHAPDLDHPPRIASPVAASDEPLATPVFIDGELVATISTGVACSGATMLQRQALEHAATVCQVLLCRERIARDAEARFLGDLVSDLVGGDGSRVADAMERARRAGHSSSVARRVVVVRPLPHSPLKQPIALQGLAQRLIANTADVLVGRYCGDLVLLWPAPSAASDGGLADTLRSHLSHGEAIGVIGQRCTHPTEYAQAYRVARGAAGLSHTVADEGSVVALADLGIYELLLQLDDVSTISRFAEATLGPLRDSDRARGTDLVRTLRVYFDNSCHTEATAQALFVHANTVNSRLRRIEKLLGITLSKPAHLLRLSAAMMADDVLRFDDDRPRTQPAPPH
jgi:sugar diacid utilization regulator/GAF domain-containing protein